MNIVEEGLDKIGSAIKTAVKDVLQVEKKVVAVFQAGEKLAPAAVADITAVVTAAENLVAAGAGAAGASGLNFAADSEAYAAYQSLQAAIVKAASTLAADVKTIEAAAAAA
jgi:hypothetical protein